MSMLNMALFATSLIMLLLAAYVSVPVDGLPYIPHLRDLIQNLAMNRSMSPSELIDTAGALYDTAVQQSANPGPNPFPGFSQATPGTFESMILRHYLKMLSSATTPSTWTAPMTTSSSMVASGAGAAGMAALLTSFLYTAWIIGSYFTDHCW